MQENSERFYNYPKTKKENRVIIRIHEIKWSIYFKLKWSCACQKMLHIRVHFPKIATWGFSICNYNIFFVRKERLYNCVKPRFSAFLFPSIIAGSIFVSLGK